MVHSIETRSFRIGKGQLPCKAGPKAYALHPVIGPLSSTFGPGGYGKSAASSRGSGGTTLAQEQQLALWSAHQCAHPFASGIELTDVEDLIVQWGRLPVHHDCHLRVLPALEPESRSLRPNDEGLEIWQGWAMGTVMQSGTGLGCRVKARGEPLRLVNLPGRLSCPLSTNPHCWGPRSWVWTSLYGTPRGE